MFTANFGFINSAYLLTSKAQTIQTQRDWVSLTAFRFDGATATPTVPSLISASFHSVTKFPARWRYQDRHESCEKT